jgi:Fe-S-cluster containining protein
VSASVSASVLDPASVYFTWPDRRLAYRCAGCGACCKGLGIGIDAAGGQLVELTTRRPGLTAFLRRRGDAITAFNPRDRCWFLADDGMCRIEVEDGRAAKPASCRLFPFNRVFTLGAVTVVDYNSVICPLYVTSGAGDGVSHGEILAELATIADPAIVGTELASDADAVKVLAGERAVAAACFAAPDPAAALTDAAIAGDPAAAAAVDAAFTALVGAPAGLPDPATLAAAVALVPSLRFNELWGPRQYAARSAMRGVLPAMTRAWLGFAAIGAELAARPLGMQELTTLWSEQAPLAYAAARWHDVPQLKPGPLELPGKDPGGLVRALGQAIVDNRRARATLGAIAAPLCARTGAVDRITAWKLAEPVLRAAFARA